MNDTQKSALVSALTGALTGAVAAAIVCSTWPNEVTVTFPEPTPEQRAESEQRREQAGDDFRANLDETFDRMRPDPKKFRYPPQKR